MSQKIKNVAVGQSKSLVDGLLEDTEQSVTPTNNSEKVKGGAAPDNSWTHFTVICSEELVEKIKFIAQTENFSIRDVVEKSFSDTISHYEAKKGKTIRLKPKSKKKDINDVL
jgi:hypothetical protein